MVAVWLVLLGLSSCAQRGPAFALQNITGLMPQLAFEMSDQDGRAVTAAEYRGQTVLLYFGYTHCPDVCPTTLATLAKVVRDLGSGGAGVRILFVTVDPARDTAPVLKSYLAYFGSDFVGLRGDDAALTALTKRYRVAYHREPADRYGNYAVDHSSAVFIFDDNGRPRLLAGAGDDSAAFTQDLRRLMTAR
ncbi:MAG TPA: SCO family protein [Steroidobacteraceae bacterium]